MIVGTIIDLSRRTGMPSLPTLRALIAKHADFPIIARGQRGVGYRIDIEAAECFIRQLAKGRALDAASRKEAIRDLGLTMLADQEREESCRD